MIEHFGSIPKERQVNLLDVHYDFEPFVDWQKVIEDPAWNMKGVFVKSGEGFSYKARGYPIYAKQIKDAGLKLGAYHYF